MTYTLPAFRLFVKESARHSVEGMEGMAYCGLGLASEAGEVADLVKNALFTRIPVDRVACALELGDVLWYTERTAQVQDLTMEQIMAISMAKIKRRNLFDKDPEAEYDMAVGILLHWGK